MIKPTKGDFDRAVSQPWSSTTCLVAQLMIRKGIQPNVVSPHPERSPVSIANENDLRQLMVEFDDAYYQKQPNIEKLREIRKSLPLFNWPWQKLKLPVNFRLSE